MRIHGFGRCPSPENSVTMKPSLWEDIASMVAIAFGATITMGITAVLLREPAVQTVPQRIPDGYRAMTLPVNDALAVAGWLKVGTRVDVLVTEKDASADAEPATKLALQNIQVLGSDRSITRDESGQVRQISYVTLLVTAADAEKLASAEVAGTLRFALRRAGGTIEVIRGTSRSQAAQRRLTP